MLSTHSLDMTATAPPNPLPTLHCELPGPDGPGPWRAGPAALQFSKLTSWRCNEPPWTRMQPPSPCAKPFAIMTLLIRPAPEAPRISMCRCTPLQSTTVSSLLDDMPRMVKFCVQNALQFVSWYHPGRSQISTTPERLAARLARPCPPAGDNNTTLSGIVAAST